MGITFALLALASPIEEAASAIEGPTRICARESSFDLVAGERITAASSGIHIGRFTIMTLRGELEFAEADAWAPARQRGTRIRLSSGLDVRRTERGGELAYAVYSGRSESPRRSPLIWLSGTAFDGSRHDKAILQRVRVQPFQRAACPYSIDYGWHLILGTEE